jgi:hypothetical protein
MGATAIVIATLSANRIRSGTMRDANTGPTMTTPAIRKNGHR